MNKCFALLLCMCIGGFLYAQVTISGTVKNESGIALANASIIVSPLNSNKVIAFKMTDSKGAFSIQVQTLLDSLQVKLNMMNHEADVKIIPNKTQEIHFTAHPKATLLEEVVVKDPMVYRKGDTIVHDVGQYANKNDRTLADVINRMPGLAIDPSGKIQYQGKDINQFSVEGKDMMQGRYGIIPNSIPYKDVSKLEVMENHQPVKMLKNKVPSENAGINIKLKKEITWTGTGSLGLGASPFLWNLKLTPMLFSKKRQALVSFKSNNTGEDIISEFGNFIGFSGFIGLSQDNETGKFLTLSSVSPPSSIAQNRYWFNTSHTASANYLYGLKKEWETKANLQYIYHELDLAGSSKTTITNLNNDGQVLNQIDYTRSSNLNNIERSVKATVSLNRNASNNFFKNDINFGYDRNSGYATIRLDGMPAYQQKQTDGFSVQNSLSALFPIDKKSKYLINLQSYINYVQDPEWYKVDTLSGLQFTNPDMQTATSLKQLKRSGSFNTTNTVNMGLSKKQWTFVPGIKFIYTNDLLNSDIELTQNGGSVQQMAIPWRNRLKMEQFNTQASLGINFKNDRYRLSLNLPFSNNTINVNDAENAFQKNLNKWLFQPSFFTELTVKKFTFSANAGRSNRFSSLTSLYPGFIFNALNITAYQSPIEEAQTTRAGSRIAYKNLLLNIDANVGYSYTYNRSNIILSRQIANNGQQVSTATLLDNSGYSHGLSLGFVKYMKKAATNIGTGISYTNSSSMYLLNNNLFTSVSHNQAASLKIENSSLNWLIASYNFVYGQSKRIDRGTDNFTTTISQAGKLSFYVFKSGSLNFSGDWNRYNIGAQKFNNQFVDASYRHTIGKRKIDVELKWMNILNTKEYEQVIINNIQTSITQFKLRPSQVLLSVRMNLR